MQLRDYQHAAQAAVWADLCNQPGNPLLVMPTGSGKSPVIGSLCQAAVEQYGGRVLVLAHRKELLEQNAEKIRAFLPANMPVGLYSAGLRRYATDEPVICGGIQSIYKKAGLFGARHLLLIDEAHLVPDADEGMYRTFIDDLRTINPRLRVVGLTATPFRTGSGSLCGSDKIFQRICYETPVKPLIDAGWLCPLVSQPGDASIDTSRLHIRGGEFIPSEAEQLFGGNVLAACQEIVAKTSDRHSVLIFCQGVSHAESVRDCLDRMTGEQVGLVTGGTSPLERESTLRAFREMRLRMVVNVDVLTTGFDAPVIDAIAVLRATMSPGLFAQIVGRGLRVHPSKDDCLVLDFGENVERHGKLDDPLYGRRPKPKGTGEAVTKTCPACGEELPGGAGECQCGFIFPPAPREPKHDGKAGDEQLIGYISEREWFEVLSVRYARHSSRKSGLDTLRVYYDCRRETGANLREEICEFVCFDHDGFARQKANLWWSARSDDPPAENVGEALESAAGGELKEPTRLEAHQEGRWWRIDRMELTEPRGAVAVVEGDDIPF